jgi:DNA-binding transcriptional MerR regulator
MSVLLSIGEFSQMTHLSVKALRHYDDVGLLPPVEVDPATGYRRYATDQVPVAHVIRRFRDLDMPLEQIRTVLDARDVADRDRAIVAHLEHMEENLERTQATVASLRALLEGSAAPLPVEYRSIEAIRAVAIRDEVDWDGTEAWLTSALDDLQRVLGGVDVRCGPDSALYSADYFHAHEGVVVAFVPIRDEIPVSGRAELIEIPAADFAVLEHRGAFSELDQAYGALGTFVAERVLGTDGAIREHYLTSVDDPDETWTEVCWPIRRVP